MTEKDLKDLIQGGRIGKVKQALDQYTFGQDLKTLLDHYNIKGHPIEDRANRPDKLVNVEATKENGEKYYIPKTVKVSRLALPIQQRIVMVNAGFVGVPQPECTPEKGKETDLLNLVNFILEDNKIEFKIQDIYKYTMSEKRSAILWFQQPLPKGSEHWDDLPIRAGIPYKIKARILAGSLGDTLKAVFDAYGDMIAFSREYTVKELVEGEVADVEHLDLYMNDRIYYTSKAEKQTDWVINEDTQTVTNPSGDNGKGVPNPFGKIPVIYFYQKKTETADVDHLIARLELLMSNHADSNNYFAAPILVAKAEVISFPDAGEQGKLIQITGQDGSVQYLTYDNIPESLKMEIENLRYEIFAATHTPDITFEKLKGMGQLAGVAIRLMFLDAELKARDTQSNYGESIYRMYNLIKQMVVVIDETFKKVKRLKIKPKFISPLPEDIAAQLENLNKAVSGGIMSVETAVEKNPLVSDIDAEKDRLTGEQTEADAKEVDKAKQLAAIAPNKPAPAGF